MKSLHITQDMKPLVAKLKKIPWLLGRHALVCIVVIVCIDVAFGEWLLYRNVVSVTMTNPQDIIMQNTLKRAVYDSVVHEWQQRKDSLQQPLGQQYQNPFAK